jgi:DNA polymerase-3 subunit gamma/tau
MSYRALYRKYRPRLFSDIVGQPAIVRALSNQVEAGRISHAYLFSGPRGTGKTSAAKVLARAINCESNDRGEACGKCKPCIELSSEANMDIVEIDAASNNSVDRVREMIENVKYMPAVGRYRVYIVDEVHMLSTSAFNALLKTLEEPPAHVVFILATTEPHKLPATVLSRCQQFQFRRISADDMVGLLEGVLGQEGASAEKEALREIARASEGGMRDALSLLDQCLSLDETCVTKARVLEMLGTSDGAFYYDVAERLLSGDAGGATELLGGFLESGGDLRTFAADLCRRMRDLFIASYVRDASGILDVSQDDAALLSEQASRHAPGDMLKCLGIVSELEGSLRYAANPRVLVELALFRCCRAEKENSYDELAARMDRLEARLAQGLPAVKPAAEPAAGPAIELALPARGTAALFEEGWDEEPPEPPDEAQEEALPGQLDLFSGFGAEPLPPESRPEPSREEAAERPEEHAAPDAPPPGKIWKAALDDLKKQPQLHAFAAKGRAAGFDGQILTISFYEDDRKAADMLSDESRLSKLNAAVDKAAGSHVEIRLKVTPWSPAQQQFVEKSRAVIPEGTIIEIERNE